MDDYQVQLLLDMVRLGTACVLFFLIVPRILFRELYTSTRDRTYSSYWGGMVLAASLYVGLVHALVLLGIYDPLILLGVVLALVATRIGFQLRGTASIGTYADLLRFIESSNWFVNIERSVKRRMGTPPTAWMWGIALTVLLIATAALRLEPVWQTASPFSLAFYDTLQDVKSMQISEMYQYDGFEERGLHGLALALHGFSQVSEATVVRLLGALSVLLLVYSIYQVTRGATNDRAAALVAASLFGIAGVLLLPVGIENQVEANPVLLATAFALPALFFGGDYLHRGARSSLLLGTAALLTCLLTSFSVAALVGAMLSLLAVLSCLLLPMASMRRRAIGLVGIGLAAQGVVWGSIWLVQQALQPTDPYAVSHFEVVANSVPSLDVQTPAATTRRLVVSAVGLLGLTACFDRYGLRQMACLTCGVFCAALYALWERPDALVFLASNFAAFEAAIPAMLLTAVLCVSAGLLASAGHAVARSFTQRQTAPVKNTTVSLSIVCLAIGGGAVSVVPLLQFEEARPEPSGYARAFDAAQRVSTPYQWTVIGHLGMKVRIQNKGYYMDHNHFVSQYDPATYDHRGEKAIPTRDVFVFVDKQPLHSSVREELEPPRADVMVKVRQWCETYATRTNDISVFYEDDAVRVYRIERSNTSLATRVVRD